MSAASSIGRVGGLAVALGVGTAVLAGHGVAWADDGAAGPGIQDRRQFVVGRPFELSECRIDSGRGCCRSHGTDRYQRQDQGQGQACEAEARFGGFPRWATR